MAVTILKIPGYLLSLTKLQKIHQQVEQFIKDWDPEEHDGEGAPAEALLLSDQLAEYIAQRKSPIRLTSTGFKVEKPN